MNRIIINTSKEILSYREVSEKYKDFFSKLTKNEKDFLKILDNRLSGDSKILNNNNIQDLNGWLIFVKPYLNGLSPDFVVFNPSAGLVFIKFNEREKYVKNKSGDLLININGKRFSVRRGNHFGQMKHFIDDFSGLMLPEIGEDADENNHFNKRILGVNLYTDINKEETIKHFGTISSSEYNIVNHFGINDDFFNLISSLENEKQQWNKTYNKKIFFYLLPPFHKRADMKIRYKLGPKQKSLLSTSPGYYRVRGVAGSGKSIALAHEAAKLAYREKRVLIITFNKSLVTFIRDVLNSTPYNFDWSLITIKHFHGFLVDLLNTYEQNNGDILNSEKDTIPLLESLTNNEKFNALLIDEGQDFSREWYDILEKIVIKGGEKVLVCADKKQNIYDKDIEWLDMRKEKGLKFEKWIDFNTTFRLSEKIAIFANNFSEKFELGVKEKIENVVQKKLFDANPVSWINIKLGEEKDPWYYIRKLAEGYVLNKYKERDIVFLFFDKISAVKCSNHLKKQGISVDEFLDSNKNNPSNNKRFKKTFSRKGEMAIVSTIHGFKGFEADDVILHIPSKDKDKKIDSVVYAAITRAKSRLIVINENDRYLDLSQNENLIDILFSEKKNDKNESISESSIFRTSPGSNKKNTPKESLKYSLTRKIKTKNINHFETIYIFGNKNNNVNKDNIKKNIDKFLKDKNISSMKVVDKTSKEYNDKKNDLSIGKALTDKKNTIFIEGQLPHKIAGYDGRNNFEARNSFLQQVRNKGTNKEKPDEISENNLISSLEKVWEQNKFKFKLK